MNEPEQEAINSYIEWRELAAEAAEAYARWAAAPVSQRERRFSEYRVALDEEEFAAICYGLAAVTVQRRRQQQQGNRAR